jgi:hypothetical protein
MASQRWLYATVDFAAGKAQLTILMTGGDHRISALGSEQEAFEAIAQMGGEGWELTSTEQQIRTLPLTHATFTDFRRLWFKKPLDD